jgi:TrmH family RNA methyltransferase
MCQSLHNIIIVLHRPRDVVNIGAVVRAMKNMGLSHLRLVDPVPYTPDDVTRLSHRAEDILVGIRTYPDLDAVLADTIYVVGTTERARGSHSVRSDLRMLALELLQRVAVGSLALLFGPEDNGLDNDARDRCHVIVRIPTDPAYPSLNLAQAALLLMYERRMAALGDIPPPTRAPTPTSQSVLGLEKQR